METKKESPMRSIIAALAILVLAAILPTAQAEGLYTQARFEQTALGKFSVTDTSYLYLGYGAGVSVLGRPDLNHLSLMVSGEVFDLDNHGDLGGREATELHWAPKPGTPVWFTLDTGLSLLPRTRITNDAQMEYLIKHGEIDPSQPTFLDIPSTWLFDVTLGFNVDLPLGYITPELEWLGIFIKPAVGVAVGPHSDITGNLMTRIMLGLRLSSPL